jgi:hypothetical protein
VCVQTQQFVVEDLRGTGGYRSAMEVEEARFVASAQQVSRPTGRGGGITGLIMNENWLRIPYVSVHLSKCPTRARQAPALLPSAPPAEAVDMEREGAALVRTSTLPVAHTKAIQELKNLKLI